MMDLGVFWILAVVKVDWVEPICNCVYDRFGCAVTHSTGFLLHCVRKLIIMAVHANLLSRTVI